VFCLGWLHAFKPGPNIELMLSCDHSSVWIWIAIMDLEIFCPNVVTNSNTNVANREQTKQSSTF